MRSKFNEMVVGKYEAIEKLLRLSMATGEQVLVHCLPKDVGTVALRMNKPADSKVSVRYESGWFIPLRADRREDRGLHLGVHHTTPRRLLLVKAVLIPT